MKIYFTIDMKEKKINFFFKQGELNKFVQSMKHRFPQWDDSTVAMRGSEYLTMCFAEAMSVIERRTKVSLKEFKPDFQFYKQKYQLPSQTQKAMLR